MLQRQCNQYNLMTSMRLYAALYARGRIPPSSHGNHPMGISNSYLLHLVAIMEPQAMYHPRLPAPLPSSIQGGHTQPTPVPTDPAVSLDAPLRSLDPSGSPVSPGSPGKFHIDVQA
jgi:hypothetical protein